MERNEKNKDKDRNKDVATGVETPPPPQIMNPTSHQEREAKKGADEKNESSRPKTEKTEKRNSKK